jgi:hypothetical protein
VTSSSLSEAVRITDGQAGLVAVGRGGAIISSTDGLEWTIRAPAGLLAGDGTELWTRTITVPAHGHVQELDVLRGAGDEAVGTAVVTTDTPEGRFFAYASIIDSHTGDPVYVPGIEVP